MRSSLRLSLLVFAGVALATLWLRGPSFGHVVWNLDEAIHATVARELLDGGVLYRDAIDQRTPLTYYAVAAVFAVSGENNLYALHVFTALLIAGTGFWLWRAGCAWRKPGTGAAAGALFVVLSVVLPYQGDAFAFNTEWAVAFFTSLAAWGFAQHVATERRRWLALTGAALGLAFLSKQPALLDAAAPGLALFYLAWRGPADRARLPLRVATLVAGWILPVALTVGWFAAQGALRDAVYYAWTYNLQVYGPEITGADRVASILKLGEMAAARAPLLLPWVVVALVIAAVRVPRQEPNADDAHTTHFLAFTLLWTLTSLGGAVSGGRGFDHYFLQTLPALCLAGGWLLARVARLVRGSHHRPLARITGAGVLLVTAAHLGQSLLEQRTRTLPRDASERAARFVGSLTTAEDRIFVWGFHPEFFLFSDRQSASRFIYSSFLTGLVPWTNTAPERDTTYAIVPGALETLLRELDARRPAFFVDCSVGPNRHWQKYPLSKFPRLQAFVEQHYVLADPDQFRGQGFDLYLLRDTSRGAPRTASATAPAQLAEPGWFGQTKVAPEPAGVIFTASCAAGQLTQLELWVNETLVASTSFAPVGSLKVFASVPWQNFGLGRHLLRVRARAADGSTRESAGSVIEVADTNLPAEQLAPFTLPYGENLLRPLFVRALFGASAEENAGQRTYYLHAPATLAYALPEGPLELSGGFGFRESAYAPTQSAPTNGADFRIELVQADGRRQVLFQRALRPLTEPADRGVQTFRIALPSNRSPRDRLEWVIGAGPDENPASDWTFWTDLRLGSSR